MLDRFDDRRYPLRGVWARAEEISHGTGLRSDRRSRFRRSDPPDVLITLCTMLNDLDVQFAFGDQFDGLGHVLEPHVVHLERRNMRPTGSAGKKDVIIRETIGAQELEKL